MFFAIFAIKIIKMEKKNTPTEKLVKQYIRYLKLERNYTVNTIEAYQHDL